MGGLKLAARRERSMQHNGCLQCLGLGVKAGIDQLHLGHHVEMLSDELTDSCAHSADSDPVPNPIAERNLRFGPEERLICRTRTAPRALPLGHCHLPPIRNPGRRTAAETVISP